MQEILFETFWRLENGCCFEGTSTDPYRRTILAADGVEDDFQNELDNINTPEEIIDVIKGLPNAWSIFYYRPDLKHLFVGRDIFGRFSLVFTNPSPEKFVIAASVRPNFTNSWYEIPHAQVTAINLEKFKAISHHFILTEEYLSRSNPWYDGLFNEINFVDPQEMDKRVMVAEDASTLNSEEQYVEDLLKRVPIVCRSFIPSDSSEIAVAFSGGVDSLYVVCSLISILEPEIRITLINVACGEDEKKCNEAPDRLRALKSWPFLKELNLDRRTRLILANISPGEIKEVRREFVAKAVAPLETVLDDSLACVLWFALRGKGNDIDTGEKVECKSKIFFVGSGADELFAGYARHRTRYVKSGETAVVEELRMELTRLGSRNGGRDARVAKQLNRILVAPFLEDELVKFANSLPLSLKCDLSQPRGLGEKKIIRNGLKLIGAPYSEPKQAMQFGSKLAKLINDCKTVKGNHISENLRENL